MQKALQTLRRRKRLPRTILVKQMLRDELAIASHRGGATYTNPSYVTAASEVERETPLVTSEHERDCILPEK